MQKCFVLNTHLCLPHFCEPPENLYNVKRLHWYTSLIFLDLEGVILWLVTNWFHNLLQWLYSKCIQITNKLLVCYWGGKNQFKSFLIIVKKSVEIIKVLYTLCTLCFVHLFVSICHGWAKFSVYVYTVTHTAILGFLLTVDGTFRQHPINPLTSLGTPFVIMETAIYNCHLLI